MSTWATGTWATGTWTTPVVIASGRPGYIIATGPGHIVTPAP